MSDVYIAYMRLADTLLQESFALQSLANRCDRMEANICGLLQDHQVQAQLRLLKVRNLLEKTFYYLKSGNRLNKLEVNKLEVKVANARQKVGIF